MQHVQNGLIIHLTNSLKILLLKTNFTPRIMTDLKKKIADRDQTCLNGQKYVTITCRNKKITFTRSHGTRGQNRYSYWP